MRWKFIVIWKHIYSYVDSGTVIEIWALMPLPKKWCHIKDCFLLTITPDEHSDKTFVKSTALLFHFAVVSDRTALWGRNMARLAWLSCANDIQRRFYSKESLFDYYRAWLFKLQISVLHTIYFWFTSRILIATSYIDIYFLRTIASCI